MYDLVILDRLRLKKKVLRFSNQIMNSEYPIPESSSNPDNGIGIISNFY